MKRIIKYILTTLLSKRLATELIIKLANVFKVDLLNLAQNSRGILNYSTFEISGEHYFINKFLPARFKDVDQKKMIFFDVGGNIGKYTINLHNSIPQAHIYTFEPNPNSYKKLISNLQNILDTTINIFPIGLSSNTETKIMTSYYEDSGSSHTSLHQEVFDEFHHSKKNIFIEANFSTLDEFCLKKDIERIDLLKIDTEGHELEVLKGAAKMLAQGRISIIQFEFGECHVYSRVFLRDFYLLLKDFKFFRLLPDRLLPLGEHSPVNEIFQFQNIIAIK